MRSPFSLPGHLGRLYFPGVLCSEAGFYSTALSLTFGGRLELMRRPGLAFIYLLIKYLFTYLAALVLSCGTLEVQSSLLTGTLSCGVWDLVP